MLEVELEMCDIFHPIPPHHSLLIFLLHLLPKELGALRAVPDVRS
jgi:hypothetical protein